MVIQEELEQILSELRQLPEETEWVEFKKDKYKPQEIGEYISALSNSACLHNKERGYLVFGIEDETHKIVGTHFKPKQTKVGNEELENWLARLLSPRIDFLIYELPYRNEPIVLFEIDATANTPVKFSGVSYIRVGSYKKKLSDYPEKERKIWSKKIGYDWSTMSCKGATIDDLDPEALLRARKEFKQKHPDLANEVDVWDDQTFLNKAKVTKRGRVTRTAIILLGKEESEHFLSPSVATITWILRDDQDLDKDYAHFGPPFILNVDRLFAKLRNLKYRYLPSGRLFPIDITQYDPWVIREALHNCIAHQDYELRGRISIIEKPDELMFNNVGSFIPGDVETVIYQNWPPDIYRNLFLAQAMVNLNMIDTIGSGIRRMFQKQKQRFFPLPDYDLSHSERVNVEISGKVLDENYTQMLSNKIDLDLETVILLDKVQKGIKITPEGHRHLRKQKLTEGRYPNIYISAHVASIIEEKAKYIKYRGLNESHYQSLVIQFIKKYGSATRSDIDALLMDKLPDILTEKQKKNKINRLLSAIMVKRLGLLKNVGSKKAPCWVLAASGRKINKNSKKD